MTVQSQFVRALEAVYEALVTEARATGMRDETAHDIAFSAVWSAASVA